MKNLASLVDKYSITIKQLRLPWTCMGACVKSADGYLVLVSDRLEGDRLKRTLRHEMLHIILGHLDDDTRTDEEQEEEVQKIIDYMGW